jgi:hypothetical protein
MTTAKLHHPSGHDPCEAATRLDVAQTKSPALGPAMRLAATNLRSLYAFDLLSVEDQDMRLEADDEPLQVRPVRIVGEGEEPGL